MEWKGIFASYTSDSELISIQDIQRTYKPKNKTFKQATYLKSVVRRRNKNGNKVSEKVLITLSN